MAELIPVLIIVALLALNALFVAAEFAIVGVPRASIERRAQQGSRVARLVRSVLADPRRQDRFIATAQLGITVASLGLGMYGEHVLADWIFHHVSTFAGAGSWAASHTLATILSVAFLTYLHIVLGEMIPKSLALQSAERTVLWITPVMRTITLAVYPLVIALNAVGNLMLRLVGINRAEGSSDHHYSPEELALIVDESEEGGQLRAEAGQMLRELFAFSDTSAREAMVPRVRVTGIEIGSAPEDVRHTAMVSGHTRYPVFDGDLDHIVGYIHIKELVALVDAGRVVTGRDAHPIPQVPDTAPLDDVLATFRRHAAPMAVVFDEHGGTAGVITLEDSVLRGRRRHPRGRRRSAGHRAGRQGRLPRRGHRAHRQGGRGARLRARAPRRRQRQRPGARRPRPAAGGRRSGRVRPRPLRGDEGRAPRRRRGAVSHVARRWCHSRAAGRRSGPLGGVSLTERRAA